MTYRKLLWSVSVVLLLLTLLLLKFVPWEALVTLLFLLGIILSPIISQLLQIAKARLTPIPQYQPSSEIPPEPTYEQGYQVYTPASSTNWSYYAQRNDQPKQDPPGAWDQHQVQSPEQAPPQIQ
jgi:hypothetical protein